MPTTVAEKILPALRQRTPMTIKQAIEKAIEGGWSGTEGLFGKHYPRTKKQREHLLKLITPTGKKYDISKYVVENLIEDGVLDPEFWQCLGKSLGWPIKKSSIGGIDIYDWNYFAREWFESIMEGKSLEDFFKTLQ